MINIPQICEEDVSEINLVRNKLRDQKSTA